MPKSDEIERGHEYEVDERPAAVADPLLMTLLAAGYNVAFRLQEGSETMPQGVITDGVWMVGTVEYRPVRSSLSRPPVPRVVVVPNPQETYARVCALKRTVESLRDVWLDEL